MKSIKSSGLYINGIISIVIGFVFVLANDKAIEGIFSITGVLIALLGLVVLTKVLFFDKSNVLKNPIFILEGILNLALGIVMFFYPNFILHFVMLLIGIWAMIIGLVQVVYFFKIKSVIKTGYYILASGILFILLGILITFYPELVVSTVAIIVGLIIIIVGIILVYLGYQINKNKENFTDYKIVE